MTTPENYADGYTAILRNPRLYKDPYWGVERATGSIYDDRAGRFYDGQVVYTSKVQAIAETAGVKYIITRNSIYKVEGEII